MKRPPAALAILAAAAALATLAAAGAATAPEWTERELTLVRSLAIAELPPPPDSPSNRVADDPAAADLGRLLFFDRRFSLDGTVSCASCHDPEQDFQDGRPVAVGIGTATRRTMPILGAAHSPFLFWDGRVDSLWAQALEPLEASVEHGGDRTRYAHLIAEEYRDAYERVFGPLPRLSHLPPHAGPVPDPGASAGWAGMTRADREAVTTVFVNMAKAVAAFERTLRPPPTRFDHWVENAVFPATGLLDEREIAGLRLFIGRAGCVNCHNGPLFTNHTFHNTGVPAGPVNDLGRVRGARLVAISRFNCRGKFSDASRGECPELRFLNNQGHATEGAFKTPGLRGVALRAPYMHAGQIATLTDVLDHYTTAPIAAVGHSELRPLRLTDSEKAALLAFLNTLVPWRPSHNEGGGTRRSGN